MDKQEIFSEILNKTVDFLTSKNIKYKVVFGTLLGFYRDGKFIDNDSDVDIAIFDEDFFSDENNFNDLLKIGFTIKRNNKALMSFNYKDYYVDLYLFTKNDELNKYFCYDYTLSESELNDNLITVNGIGTYQTIYGIKDYLIRHYGETWTIPQNGKCALSSYNLVKNHWTEYYERGFKRTESDLARFAVDHIKKTDRVIDIGCGTGDDTLYLSNYCSYIKGIDGYAKFPFTQNMNVSFENIDFYQLHKLKEDKFDVVYCRWVIHAIHENVQKSLIDKIRNIMNSGSRLIIECRGIDSELMNVGLKISDNEFIHGHYRRFIKPNSLMSMLDKYGFYLLYFKSSDTFSISGDNKPILNRYVFKKM